MPAPFSQCVESLERDSDRGSRVFLLMIAAASVVWSSWFFFGKLDVHRATNRAWIESSTFARPIHAEVSGRVLENHLELGKAVREGDVLVVLDAQAEQLLLAEEIARRDSAKKQLDLAEKEREAEELVLASLKQHAEKSAAVAHTQRRITESVASVVNEETDRVRRLREAGVVSQISALEQEMKQVQTQGSIALGKAEASRLAATNEVEVRDRFARFQRLERDVTVLRGTVELSGKVIARLEHDIERRRIRAPATGHIAEVGAISIGVLVTDGHRLGTVVPDGPLRAVAEYPPGDAVGVIHPGQAATLRLHAFPWITDGAVRGTVSRVALVPDNDHIRVEIELSAPRLPLHHGLTGTAEILVETVAPKRVALRAAGMLLSETGSEPAKPAP